MNLDTTDRKLLNLMQAEFPLTVEPYADLGGRLGIDGDEVLRRIRHLKTGGFVREVSPVLDARRLGYQTTLVAMRVAETDLDKAERLIGEHPGVSHGYERDHHFNLWFTLAIPPPADIETELEQLTRPINAEAVFALPALQLFKIRAYFDMDETGPPAGETITPADGVLPQKIALSPIERRIINELQEDLPLVATPFTAIAERSGMDVDHFLAQCQSLLQRGIVRRFGAFLNHNRAGFAANAMTCWRAPATTVVSAGRKLASLPEVSHCYERATNPLWQYNLFAMIHGHTREACHQVVSRICQETGLTDYIELYSTREFKKARVKYLV